MLNFTGYSENSKCFLYFYVWSFLELDIEMEINCWKDVTFYYKNSFYFVKFASFWKEYLHYYNNMFGFYDFGKWILVLDLSDSEVRIVVF